MLGGRTATLHEGRVTQYGPTSQVYRSPNTLLSAQVFSDPPINTAPVDKRNDTFNLTDLISWPVAHEYGTLPDGQYIIGVRPHHLTVGTAAKDTVKLNGTVQIAEISGSESIIHFNVEGHTWVSESHGVHQYKVGDSVELSLDVSRCLYFHENGKLVTG